MALNNTLKTRILLRNDTLANWESSDLVLGKGEVAIATLTGGELAEVRVGTGSSTWATSLKLNVNADQISGLIETIQGTAKKYQVVANGEGGNSWKLQEAALSGGDWSDVTGSTWTVDFSAITTAIDGLTAGVDYLSGQIDATNATLNTISSDYLKATDFAALSNDTGLSAASASNPVVTKNDIADLAGAMHFRGAVSDPSEITDPAAGDIIIIPSTSKEYVYNGTEWIELGDEVLYATKAEVATISGELTSDIADITADVDYLSGQIDATNATLNTISSDYLTSADKTELETLVGTTSAETLVSANAYTDSKVDSLSDSLSDYYTKADTSSAVEIENAVDELDEKITKKIFIDNQISNINGYSDLSVVRLNAADYGTLLANNQVLSNALYVVEDDHEDAYGRQIKNVADATDLSDAVNLGQMSQTSAATLEAANAYTDTKFADLSNVYTKDEVNAISADLSAASKDYTDEQIAALSADEFIRHGECVQSDLSGFFVLDCGGSALRTDEPTA